MLPKKLDMSFCIHLSIDMWIKHQQSMNGVIKSPKISSCKLEILMTMTLWTYKSAEHGITCYVKDWHSIRWHIIIIVSNLFCTVQIYLSYTMPSNVTHTLCTFLLFWVIGKTHLFTFLSYKFPVYEITCKNTVWLQAKPSCFRSIL